MNKTVYIAFYTICVYEDSGFFGVFSTRENATKSLAEHIRKQNDRFPGLCGDIVFHDTDTDENVIEKFNTDEMYQAKVVEYNLDTKISIYDIDEDDEEYEED